MPATTEPIHEYAFDCKLVAVVRVKAKSESDAHQALADILDAAVPSDGWVEGYNGAAASGVQITEVSLSEEDTFLFEIDGEEPAE